MPIDTANGILASRPPRTVITTDSRAGCPGADAAGPYNTNNNLLTQTIVLSSSSVVWIQGRMIYNNLGRCDMQLFINNVAYCNGLQNVQTTANWEEENVSWALVLAAGTYNIELRRSTCSGRWGCGGDWGEIISIIWEQ